MAEAREGNIERKILLDFLFLLSYDTFPFFFCSCPLTPTVSKASSGAMEVFDVYSTDDLRGFLKVE